ncbi:MAG: hypothetical protein ACOY42_06775 [Pseudomonadota bacterium]
MVSTAGCQQAELGRRNLTPDEFRYLVGRRYKRCKRQGARTDLTSDQSDTKSQTAKSLAAEYGMGEATVKRAQGHALAIEARAKIRLADEYDAAQERGEVAGHGQRGPGKDVVSSNVFSPATAADLGLRRDEIFEARQLRDAELACATR